MTFSRSRSDLADEEVQAPSSARWEEMESLLVHELETPLAVIQAAATIALDDAARLTEMERRDLLAVVQRNSELAIRVLRRVGLAREIDAGRVTLDRSTVDLGTLVREVVDDLRRVVLTDHPVHVDVAGGPAIEIDPTATREILFNLLANAAKYSAAGARISVTVTTTGPVAEVVVRDHGSGVSPGETERIFVKYQQGDHGGPGAGLGLFVSRGLARAHGGDLQVQPAGRVGSEFHLTLPRRVT